MNPINFNSFDTFFFRFVLNLLNFILMTDNICCPSKSPCHSIDEPTTLKHSNYSRIKIKKYELEDPHYLPEIHLLLVFTCTIDSWLLIMHACRCYNTCQGIFACEFSGTNAKFPWSFISELIMPWHQVTGALLGRHMSTYQLPPCHAVCLPTVRST